MINLKWTPIGIRMHFLTTLARMFISYILRHRPAAAAAYYRTKRARVRKPKSVSR